MAAAKQFELLFQLTARLGPNFSQSFKNASKTMNALQNDLRSADQKLKDVSAYQKQQNAVAKSRARVNELQAEHERLTREIEETGQATPELTRQLQANERALQKAEDATAREEERLQELSDTLREAGVNTDNLGRDTEGLRQQYERLEQTQKKVQEITEKQAANKQAISQTKAQLGGLIGTVTAIGAAIYAGPVKNAQEFQQSMAKVGTIADTNVVPLAQLRQEIIALSNETGKSVNDLAEDVYSAISAGQDTADAVGFVTNATKLSTAGFAESAQAVDVLSTILNAYGMEAEKVTDVSDMLINTQNKGKTTVGELASSMGKIIPTANANNVALEQICAGYEKLTAKGIATAEATTYMNGMLNELGKTGSTTDKLLREKTGKSFKELMASGSSLADVLQIVKDGAESSGMSLSDMFGSSEAGKAALSLMADGVDSFNESVQGMLDSCGATEEAYAKMMDTTETKVAKAKNSISNLGTVLGDMLLPYVGMVADKVSEVVTKFSEFAQENPQVIATVAKVAAGLVGLKAGGLIAKLGFLQVKGGILSVQKAFTMIKGLGITKYLSNMGGGFGGILTKVAPLVGVIAAVGGAIYYVSTHLEQVRGFIQKTFGDEGLAVFDKLWGIITQVGTAIKDAFFASGSGVLDTLKSILPTIINTLQTGLLPILPMIADLFMQILPLIGQLVTAILPVLGELLSAVITVLASLIAEILPVIVQLISAILPLVLQIVQSVLPVFIQLVNTIVPVLVQIIQAVLPVIIQLIQTLLPIIMQIVDAVLPVFISLLNTIVPIFQNIIQAILPVLQQLLQALIPVIQLVAEIFANVLGTALQSIANIVSSVMQVFQGLIDFITGVFTGNWSQAWEGIKSIFSGVFSGLGEIFKAPFKVIVSVINTVIRGLNKLKVPDWVPGIGGMGINIPEIPGFAKGTNRTPSTFIAGENGPELITDAANRKVFTAAQTGQIFNNMAQAGNLNTANNVNATAGGAGTITIHVTNSPSVTVAGGGDTSGIKEQLQQYDEEFLEKLREIIRTILKEQREQEGRVAYA
ncbi:phage tail tape measure protein [Roseburia sp. 1XD42-69]|uniref:phage tail tape measure protein n=1 Tax=Roseburia sp. 1XD42-69 TaxID=2320088 RepID=UPI000EA13542|nr:phage tail tape measure protein [Roseburia sp. 1XD42-69]RKJ67476.1 phage tail tape measure protein [Roseburia sp. 1XD42-69]